MNIITPQKIVLISGNTSVKKIFFFSRDGVRCRERERETEGEREGERGGERERFTEYLYSKSATEKWILETIRCT